jgi:DNA primase
MALIKESSVQEVRETADIVELAGARTQLRRVGGRWTGRCPFHEERTPSFSVSPEKKTYYCFGCQAGGDVITFVRETEGLDFVGAVEWLADRYRVSLDYEEASPELEAGRRQRDRLISLLEAAAHFYERYLWEAAAGERVRAYLTERGLREEVCREFRLGLSPGGDTMPGKAREKGFTRPELTAAGLVNRRGNDYYGGRLVFPLADARGRVLGFGARRLSGSDPIEAKYVNSPESDLFHKASLVYGLDRARASIAKQDLAILVEGYTDVLALHQAGLKTAVAVMGTALTERQLRELRRLCSRVVLCFDSDTAGEAATLRGMDLAYREFNEVRVVSLEAGTDPAEAGDRFAAYLESAESYPRYRIKLEIERAPTREAAFQRVQEIVGAFDRNTEWMDAVELAADELDLPRDLQAALAPRASRSTGEISRKVLEAGGWLEQRVLAGCLAHRELAGALAEVSPEHFDSEPHRRLRQRILEGGSTETDLVALEAELDALAASEGIDLETAKELLLRLRERHLKRELASADLERTKELQAQLARILAAVSDLA